MTSARSELETLRSSLPGVLGSLIVTSDGLLVVDDCTSDDGVEQTAALSSTLLALARHAASLTSRGSLLDAVVRGSEGYFVVYAISETAVLAVIGSNDLNLALLHLKTRPVVARLADLAADFPHFEPTPA